MITQEAIIQQRYLRKSFAYAENGAGAVCTHTGIASVNLLF